ncbi:Dehydroquinate synthase-like protein [Aulographum hederae CBS 113979]|uniref:Dehydroquinate synthase-like protein n=1 Tax=Aulographum hederae CBS 113979 TaxID=1176131 RepID=A0A6G1H2Y5_9PEZI|nr:Dehydroquinate synthase-like protein [Aulographum hederae CBS 113979]
MAVESTNNPLSGLWKSTHIEKLFYGPDSVKKHLLSALPSESSKAFILTGASLATKTSLIKQVEELLGSKHHAGTFADIKQHAPVAQLDRATEAVTNDSTIDTIISVGGGSPIDSAKAISHRVHEKAGKYLYHITIPTTLSAAECTMAAGYTSSDGLKIGVASPELVPHVILYDALFARETPQKLWLSTGLRAVDHAVELMYHPTAAELPTKTMALSAVERLFKYLRLSKRDPRDLDVITQLQLAAYASLGFYGLNIQGPLGLSHVLGYALGSPYGIPHGVTSCLTLGHVVKLKAASDPASAAPQIARMLPLVKEGGAGRTGSDNATDDAREVGDEILRLVQDLGLKTTLTELGVGQDQAKVVAKRATGGKEEGDEVFESVLGLVKGLY